LLAGYWYWPYAVLSLATPHYAINSYAITPLLPLRHCFHYAFAILLLIIFAAIDVSHFHWFAPLITPLILAIDAIFVILMIIATPLACHAVIFAAFISFFHWLWWPHIIIWLTSHCFFGWLPHYIFRHWASIIDYDSRWLPPMPPAADWWLSLPSLPDAFNISAFIATIAINIFYWLADTADTLISDIATYMAII